MSLDAYRVSQLEKELEAVKRERENLSFGQIKQMFTYIGLPVAVATGVFGVALWQTLKSETVTAAEIRADSKVAELTNEVSDLEASIRRIASNAEKTFGDIREKKGQALEAAASARSRANDAFNELTRIKTEVANSREALAAIQTTENIANQIAGSEGFKDAVLGKTLGSFNGMVAAFAGECPVELGWVPFEDADGRMIVGAGSLDDGQEKREFLFGETDGKFRHILELHEMPAHDHEAKGDPAGSDFYVLRTKGGNNSYPDNGGIPIADSSVRLYGNTSIPEAGEGKPHNNMPPYIALNFCKKEG